MKSTRFLAAFAVACAAIMCPISSPAQVISDCRPVTSGTPEPGQWTVGAKPFAILWEVYERIAKAADYWPDLWMCESLAAQAAARADIGAIMVTTGLLRMTAGDADELAAVVGHEFGHLLHNHAERKRAALQMAQHQYSRSVARGAVTDKQQLAAVLNAWSGFTAFSRETEREADDEGFSLARRAGYSHAGMRRVFEKMAQKYGSGQSGGYLATHPGLGERVKDSTRLEVNEIYRDRAARHFEAKDTAKLREVVDQWRREVPDSGAAAYYDAMHALMTGNGSAAAKLDEAVGYFHGEGLSSIAQAYQAESSHAPLALCVSLYRQGEKARALNCLQLLKSDEELRQFREITGWNAFVFVPARRDEASSLYASRVVNNTVAMTNCKRVADEASLPLARPWRVPPPAGNAPSESPQMVCSPDLCNCQALSEAEKEAVSRAARMRP